MYHPAMHSMPHQMGVYQPLVHAGPSAPAGGITTAGAMTPGGQVRYVHSSGVPMNISGMHTAPVRVSPLNSQTGVRTESPSQGARYASTVDATTTHQMFIPSGASSSRVQLLEQRIRQLELECSDKDKTIKELETAVYGKGPAAAASKKGRSPPARSRSGFKPSSNTKPIVPYTAVDPDDVIDVRLEEFYNSTSSAIQFKRVNKGFYRFGDTIVELSIINHKLMARTEEAFNRGKFGPMEKFIVFYENIEREKAGIEFDA